MKTGFINFVVGGGLKSAVRPNEKYNFKKNPILILLFIFYHRAILSILKNYSKPTSCTEYISLGKITL